MPSFDRIACDRSAGMRKRAYLLATGLNEADGAGVIIVSYAATRLLTSCPIICPLRSREGGGIKR
jgi:hypothetical protein